MCFSLLLQLASCSAALHELCNPLLEDMAICMSKCAPNVANGTGVKSGVSWMPDGVSLIHLIHQEQSPMVTLFSKLLFCCMVFYQWLVLCVLIQQQGLQSLSWTGRSRNPEAIH